LDKDGKISFEEFTRMVENTDVSMSMTLGELAHRQDEYSRDTDSRNRSILAEAASTAPISTTAKTPSAALQLTVELPELLISMTLHCTALILHHWRLQPDLICFAKDLKSIWI
jgi:hypothetical protein